MTVYVDPLFKTAASRRWPYRQACHLVADSEEELREFARRLGLKPGWIQSPGVHSRVHFGLTDGMRRKAVALGAVELSRRELAELFHRQREEERADAG